MFTINYQSREPIYEQLYNNVIRLIGMEVLHPHDKLPTVRALAGELGINPNTVSKAYQMLEQNGYLYSAVGKGSFVSDNVSAIDGKKNEVKNQLSEVVKAASNAGITKHEIIAIVDDVYPGGDIS
ncbi:MAG: GntR family transcriptional regulator [Acutalibacteraceae bacterium]|nr:GntR family transcriptional regulator [Clostridia bacterium]MEE3449695.1 GntR family transcriptional regulator [Acutalibacteraceae bacterium]